MMTSDAPWTRQFMKGLPDGPAPFHYPAAELEKDLMGH
jgi:phospholipid/cholesterol/gamma-HCH transport system ATP-binding protein